MFSLFKGAYGEITRKDEFFVAVIGLDGAGKTTYLEQVRPLFYKHHRKRDLTKITSTVGLNHIKISLKDIVVNFWDLGGQRELRSLWNTYLEECQALVFVVDSTDIARLEEVFNTLERILGIDRIRNLPLMILFNKCDLNGEQQESPPGSRCTGDSNRTPATSGINGDCGESAAAAITSPVSPTLSNGRGGWSSFELEEEMGEGSEWASSERADGTGDWASSDCGGGEHSATSSWASTHSGDQQQQQSPNNLMERFRRQYFNNHISTVHHADVAIFSISALHNTNVKRSVTWLFNALTSLPPSNQRH